MSKTISQCLATIEIPEADLAQCSDLLEEFTLIKKAYFKNVLKSHPDKGGDAGNAPLPNYLVEY